MAGLQSRHAPPLPTARSQRRGNPRKIVNAINLIIPVYQRQARQLKYPIDKEARVIHASITARRGEADGGSKHDIRPPGDIRITAMEPHHDTSGIPSIGDAYRDDLTIRIESDHVSAVPGFRTRMIETIASRNSRTARTGRKHRIIHGRRLFPMRSDYFNGLLGNSPRGRRCNYRRTYVP